MARLVLLGNSGDVGPFATAIHGYAGQPDPHYVHWLSFHCSYSQWLTRTRSDLPCRRVG